MKRPGAQRSADGGSPVARASLGSTGSAGLPLVLNPRSVVALPLLGRDARFDDEECNFNIAEVDRPVAVLDDVEHGHMPEALLHPRDSFGSEPPGQVAKLLAILAKDADGVRIEPVVR